LGDFRHPRCSNLLHEYSFGQRFGNQPLISSQIKLHLKLRALTVPLLRNDMRNKDGSISR
jgi:hypothetical protein